MTSRRESDRVALTLESHFRWSNRPGLVSAYLFGSHGRGAAHRQSDVDVAVLLSWDRFPSSRSRFDERVALTSALIDALDHNEVDIVILNDAPPLFGRHILAEGRRVYCADPQADHDFVRDVQLRAADLQPFLRRMQRLKLDALSR
jgi:predicted nucleotidyltransferase